MEVFELALEVAEADIDLLGHVNNVTYVRWVQEAAVAHWRAAAEAEDQAALFWVVLRHEIDYRRPAFAGDRLIARTWVGCASGIRFERWTEILRDGSVLASARTLWCPLSQQTKRPVAVRSEVRKRFSTEERASL